MRPFTGSIGRFAAVGVANTAIGATLIFGSMALGAGDVFANFIGYAAGLGFGFVANGRWTFTQRRLTGGAAVRYGAVIAIAYLLNVGALELFTKALHAGSVAGQLAGIAIYALVGYLGMRYCVFRQSLPDAD